MDLDEFSKLKTPHLITISFCFLCFTALGGYFVNHLATKNTPINSSRRDCVCDSTNKANTSDNNGTPEHKADQQFISPSGDFICGPQRTK